MNFSQKKLLQPREQSLVLWIVLHCGLEIPLEENKQSCEAVRLQKVNTKNLRTNFAFEYSPWCWLFSCSCLQCPGGRSPQNRPRVATFHSSSNPDRIFYPKQFRIGNSIRQGFFQKIPSDRILYPKRFRIENSIRRCFWQTLSDRISYPKLFRIVNSIRQGFVQGNINVT